MLQEEVLPTRPGVNHSVGLEVGLRRTGCPQPRILDRGEGRSIHHPLSPLLSTLPILSGRRHRRIFPPSLCHWRRCCWRRRTPPHQFVQQRLRTDFRPVPHELQLNSRRMQPPEHAFGGEVV